ncbi:hypothetical protein Psch_00466 [Pelotomaculum schinkii]|uniref:FeS cluster biogenesis domain-containing protein n=1 Tax=Pelotomaculum schinkii TaxID=78350 RepID=A0A4Y7RE01_9FIRM|nr:MULTISPECIES: CC/Se motif family (seleno)protein [Pelotomaculum]TEB06932.1 hypothetical protein Psch_00466 [Pelotomaculum schinkii]TEB15439.1 hypothetical protein Psfp_02086 [Pelotomaculum sp. FP]
MIKVEISEDARDYILKTSDTITVDLVIMSGCFGATNEPLVSIGEPSVLENYDEVIADGIKVYFFKGAVSAPDGIRIYLEGNRLVYQSLQIEGLIYEFTPLPS